MTVCRLTEVSVYTFTIAWHLLSSSMHSLGPCTDHSDEIASNPPHLASSVPSPLAAPTCNLQFVKIGMLDENKLANDGIEQYVRHGACLNGQKMAPNVTVTLAGKKVTLSPAEANADLASGMRCNWGYEFTYTLTDSMAKKVVSRYGSMNGQVTFRVVITHTPLIWGLKH